MPTQRSGKGRGNASPPAKDRPVKVVRVRNVRANIWADPSCRGSTSTLRPRSRKPGRQNPRHDKTTVHELPNQDPTLDEELPAKRARPQAPDRYSTGLKAGHDFWTEQIARARPHTAPDQM